MGLMLLQLACVVLVMLRHGTDAQVTAFTKPTSGDNVANIGAVTTDVTGSGVEYTAALTVLEGVTGPVTTVLATTTDNTKDPIYNTASTEFAVDSSSGVVSVVATHTISFATKASYSLVITAKETDADANAATGTLTITVTVNAIPVFTSPTVCWYLPDDQAASTTVATYSATAGLGETITYAVAAGNTNTDFTAAMADGKLVTENQMAKETTAAYTLTLTAVDNSAVPGTATVSVDVIIRDVGTTMESADTCGGASGVVGSLLVVLSLLMAKFL